ncbi:MAG: SpoIID/LytB domain-containing protein [Chloracidobacterium sp.]|nr:SpoIID/LytB domain-containing protein [Chloracidobacterium sp.]MDW8216742.1 SpoIID/LytB domain-containing protein [Acidobacteriota bacterium]
MACWLVLCLISSSLSAAAQVTRPRRVAEPASAAPPSPVTKNTPPKLETEPEIRIALATNADFATVTCDGTMSVLDAATSEPLPINARKATVQLEFAPPKGAERYRVEVAAFKTRTAAEEAMARLRERVPGPVVTRYDAREKSYVVVVGDCAAPEDAEALMVSVVNAGFRRPVVTRDAPSSPAGSPTPRLGVTADGGESLLRGAQSCTFVALDEDRAPLKFGGQSYRGRIEVFLNRRGRLTVVNVVPVEAYLRGVVPNELSPTVFSNLEALKAQAIAARTYALKNRGKYAAEGYDLLPTAASQVYRGQGSEHPLSDRAVLETRGVVATYHGEPIDALYTSTSGGRTESSEYVFGSPQPYLKSVLVAPQTRASRWVTSTRSWEGRRNLEPRLPARDWALLTVAGFPLPERLTAAYCEAPATVREVTLWLNTAARLAQTGAGERATGDVLRLGGFAQALAAALYGAESPTRLVTPEDARYWLGTEAERFRPEERPALAYFVREQALRPTLLLAGDRPLTRGAALGWLARALAGRGLPPLQSGRARPYDGKTLTLRMGNGKDDQSWTVAPDVFLFRNFGGECLPVERLEIIGGEQVRLYADADNRVRYLEVTPVMNGATSDRSSQFSWWDVRLTAAELQTQLAKAGVNVGEVRELTALARGDSGRVARLRVVGTRGTSELTGLKIRSALGLRENLFVVIREWDAAGRLVGVRFIGRGWGHGVGMCQVGAYGLAVEGYTHERILKHFYTGITLTRLYP